MTPIVFDLDGTLIDSLPDVTAAANALLSEYDHTPVSQSQVNGFVGMGEGVFIDRLISATGLEPAKRGEILRCFIGHYKIAAQNTQLFPGSLEALHQLKALGGALALCTNKPQAALTPTLIAGGLDHVFDVIVAGDTLPVRKPNPEPVFHILKELRVDTCLYVGDSEVDAETAKRAGVPFILYTEGIRQSPIEDIPHDRAFSEFSQLAQICVDFS